MKKHLLFFFFILFSPYVAYGTITHDKTSSNNLGTVSSGNLSHTIGGGSNRLLVVSIRTNCTNSANCDVSTVTYNGVAMTKAREELVGSLFSWLNVEIWYMLEANLPGAGTYNVSFTLGGSSSNVVIAATSVTGAKQQGPTATRGKDCSGANSCSRQIVTSANNTWIFDLMGVGSSTTLDPDISQTERWDRSYAAGSTKVLSSAGTTEMVWSFGGTMSLAAIVMAAFAPHVADITLTNVGNIGTAENFGTHEVTIFSGNLVSVTSINSAETFGTAVLARILESNIDPINSKERIPYPFVWSQLIPDPTPVTPNLIPE